MDARCHASQSRTSACSHVPISSSHAATAFSAAKREADPISRLLPALDETTRNQDHWQESQCRAEVYRMEDAIVPRDGLLSSVTAHPLRGFGISVAVACCWRGCLGACWTYGIYKGRVGEEVCPPQKCETSSLDSHGSGTSTRVYQKLERPLLSREQHCVFHTVITIQQCRPCCNS